MSQENVEIVREANAYGDDEGRRTRRRDVDL